MQTLSHEASTSTSLVRLLVGLRERVVAAMKAKTRESKRDGREKECDVGRRKEERKSGLVKSFE